jgi:hypothetical protein
MHLKRRMVLVVAPVFPAMTLFGACLVLNPPLQLIMHTIHSLRKPKILIQ